MSEQYRAIPTIYNGIEFRSRLEARWAVFFDGIGVKYQYEPEGYDLGFAKLGYYLPDFWISDWDCFIEIKPTHPKLEETLKVQALAEITKSKAFIFGGQIIDFMYEDGIVFTAGFPEDDDLSRYCPSCPRADGEKCICNSDTEYLCRYVPQGCCVDYVPTNGFIRVGFGECRTCGKTHIFKFWANISKDGDRYSDFWSDGFCCHDHLDPHGWLMYNWGSYKKRPLNEATDSYLAHNGKLPLIYAAFKNAIRYSFWSTSPTAASIRDRQIFRPGPKNTRLTEIKTIHSWKMKKTVHTGQ